MRYYNHETNNKNHTSVSVLYLDGRLFRVSIADDWELAQSHDPMRVEMWSEDTEARIVYVLIESVVPT